MKLIKNPWLGLLTDLSTNAKESIKITAPYVKSNMVDKVLEAKADRVSLCLITSFKLQNYYRGASDLKALTQILNTGGAAFNFQQLHAKTYLFDDSAAIITSANLTANGLLHNYEYGILVDNQMLVKEILDDFNKLTKHELTGKITNTEIEKAADIISNAPKAVAIHLPEVEFESVAEDNDIYTAGIETILPAFKGWTLVVFTCLSKLNKPVFDTDDTHQFIPILKAKYPGNNNIEAKIRQQLQILRDNGLIEFIERGKYRKLWR